MSRLGKTFYRATLALAALTFVYAFFGGAQTARASFDCTTITDVTQAECESLLAIYDATDGDNWNDNTNWGVSTSVCSWYGVDCEFPSNRVFGISLSYNNLIGVIPADVMHFAYLEFLSLDGNELSGSLPAVLPPSLRYFSAGENQLTGAIPAGYNGTNLPFLEGIWLTGNQLSGTFPVHLTTIITLDTLRLGNNQFEGTIPAEIGNLSNLWALELGRNQFTGTLPDELFTLTGLGSLDLSNDFPMSGIKPDFTFSGTIPAGLSNLDNLLYLLLNNNNFTGPMPPLHPDAPLELLFIENAFQRPQFSVQTCQGFGYDSGEISTWLTGTNYPTLLSLSISDNCFTGTLPDMTGAGDLTSFSARGNAWTPGGFPQWLIDSQVIESFDLTRTERTGALPVFASEELIQISAPENYLTGNIPTGYNGTNYPNLQFLNLYANNMSGDIPTEIGTIGTLRYFGIQGNNFISLPDSIVTGWTDMNTDPSAGKLWVNFNQFDEADMSASLLTFVNNNARPISALSWQNTQTLPPGNVQATGTTSSSVTLSWDKRGEDIYFGRFEVGYSTTSGGTYTFDSANFTANKDTTTLTVTGLDPDTEYFFVVRKHRFFQPFFVPNSISKNSAEVNATTDSGPVASADLGVGISRTPSSVVVDNDVTFTITVTNNGPDNATGVTVSNNFTGAAVTVNSVASSQGGCDALPCTLGAINDGANATVTIVVTADEIGTITSTASVSGNEADPQSGNDTASINTTVTDTPVEPPTDPPAAPELLSPADGATVVGELPVFIWNPNPVMDQVTTYRLTLFDKRGDVLTNYNLSADTCGLNCVVEGGDLGVTFKGDPYTWRVRASNVAGNTNSDTFGFELDVPGTPVLLTPGGVVYPADITFEWQYVGFAEEFRLTVQTSPEGVQQYRSSWLTASTLGCEQTGETCTFVAPVELASGDYQWFVQARNRDLFDGNSKSDTLTFSVDYPAAPVIVSPMGDVAINDVIPSVFEWQDTDNDQAWLQYRLTVRDTATRTQALRSSWLDRGDVCVDADCSYSFSGAALPADGYEWSVQVRDNTLEGKFQNRSTWETFTIDYPVKPVPQAPITVTVDTPTPTLQWTDEDTGGVVQYRVTIRDVKTNEQIERSSWMNQVDVCSSGISSECSYTVTTPLRNREYTWFVQSRDNRFDFKLQAKSFTAGFDVAFPSVPTAHFPVDTTVGFAPPSSFIFQWVESTGAAEYRVQVRTAITRVQVFNSGWFDVASADCDGSFCSLYPLMGLSNGNYEWRVQARDASVVSGNANSGWQSFTVSSPVEASGLSGSLTNTVSWTASSSYASEWRVQVRRLSDNVTVYNSGWFPHCLDNSCSHTLTETLPAGQYRWRVQARNINGTANSDWVEETIP